MRVMIDLARNGRENYVKLQDLAKRQEISEKYLEGILGSLVRAKLLKGVRGKAGGYKFNCDPSKCSVFDVLKHTEISVSPVICLEDKSEACPRKKKCDTFPIWKELEQLIQSYLKSITLDQFINVTSKCKKRFAPSK